jgi:hypothetical protein
VSLDWYGQKCFPFNLICYDEPMTAIARIYTPEGFVVATDGRRNRPDGGVESDDAQKVFQLDHPAGKMCFSIAGIGSYSFGSGREDVSSVVGRAAMKVEATEIKNPDGYAESLMVQICREIDGWNLSSLASGSVTETRIHLDGYIRERPMRRTITLDYKSETPSVEADSTDPGALLGYGSQLIWNILFGPAPDNRLSPYRQICQSRPVTLPQAMVVCHAFIRAHCDPEALTIDRHYCQGVGGRIRIATVTPSEGFRMVSETDCPQSI